MNRDRELLAGGTTHGLSSLLLSASCANQVDVVEYVDSLNCLMLEAHEAWVAHDQA